MVANIQLIRMKKWKRCANRKRKEKTIGKGHCRMIKTNLKAESLLLVVLDMLIIYYDIVLQVK